MMDDWLCKWILVPVLYYLGFLFLISVICIATAVAWLSMQSLIGWW